MRDLGTGPKGIAMVMGNTSAPQNVVGEIKDFNKVAEANLKPNSKKSSDQLMKVVSDPNASDSNWRTAWQELSDRHEVESKAAQPKQASFMTNVLTCVLCVTSAMLITIVILYFNSQPAFPAGNAAKASFDKGVENYLQDKYQDALTKFEEAVKTDTKNPKLHYYLALCHQALDNDKKAAEEYALALEHSTDAAFKEIVTERLARTKRRLDKTKAPAEAEKPALAEKHDPVKKVIWFSTNWCSHCKKFKTAWEAAESKYGKELKFEHLNAEDPSAWKQVQVYRPKAYPTLVYLDSKDKVIENHADAPSTDDFIKHLQSLGASK